MQVLKLCQSAGLVKLGHVAVDGTKLKANASRHKAMSYGRMKQSEAKLAAEVAAWLKAAEAADAAEDAEFGADRRGDETPDWMADKQKRLERIREAKAELEAEAKSDPADADPDGPGPSSGMTGAGAASGPRTATRRTRPSATSPTPTAASSRPATASSPATTARSPSITPIRSSSPRGCRPTRPITPPWSRWSIRPGPTWVAS